MKLRWYNTDDPRDGHIRILQYLNEKGEWVDVEEVEDYDERPKED